MKQFVADLQRALAAEGDDAASDAYDGAAAANARAAGGEGGEGGEAYLWLDPGNTPFEFRALSATLDSVCSRLEARARAGAAGAVRGVGAAR